MKNAEGMSPKRTAALLQQSKQKSLVTGPAAAWVVSPQTYACVCPVAPRRCGVVLGNWQLQLDETPSGHNAGIRRCLDPGGLGKLELNICFLHVLLETPSTRFQWEVKLRGRGPHTPGDRPDCLRDRMVESWGPVVPLRSVFRLIATL